MDTAKAQKSPVLIKFEAVWCSWCEQMDREVFAQPQIVEALEHYVCIRVDVDKQHNVALAYKIRTLPRIVVVNIYGEIVGDWLGFRDAPAFSKLLEDVSEYALTQTGTMSAPTVRVEPLTSAQSKRFVGVRLDPGDSNTLINLLGHKNPAPRASAISVLVRGGAKSLPVVVQALESKYLGTRIAAWKVLQQLKGSRFALDPWAPGPERELAIRKLRTQLDLALPETSMKPPTET